MTAKGRPNVRSAEVVFRCSDLQGTIAALGAIGFRLDTIMPADDPSAALLSGHGVSLRLERSATTSPAGASLRLVCGDPSLVPSGLGIPVDLVAEEAPLAGASAGELLVTRNGEEGAMWKLGRASMQYRDLIVDRLGGRVIASHIRIPEGGAVPDYVHFHDVRFQLIHCYKGWVRLVYEDQGAPFVLEAGETVLQPPRIRHRVLESSIGLEVIGIGSPAFHPTHTEHDMTLPTPNGRSDREWDGQRFIVAGTRPGTTDCAFAGATGDLVNVRLLGAGDPSRARDSDHVFGFVRHGAMTIRCGDRVEELRAEDAFVVPNGASYSLADEAPDLSWLEVTMRL